jgi:hypothetical protein
MLMWATVIIALFGGLHSERVTRQHNEQVTFIESHHSREEKRLLIDRGIQEAFLMRKTMATWINSEWPFIICQGLWF